MNAVCKLFKGVFHYLLFLCELAFREIKALQESEDNHHVS